MQRLCWMIVEWEHHCSALDQYEDEAMEMLRYMLTFYIVMIMNNDGWYWSQNTGSSDVFDIHFTIIRLTPTALEKLTLRSFASCVRQENIPNQQREMQIITRHQGHASGWSSRKYFHSMQQVIESNCTGNVGGFNAADEAFNQVCKKSINWISWMYMTKIILDLISIPSSQCFRSWTSKEASWSS